MEGELSADNYICRRSFILGICLLQSGIRTILHGLSIPSKHIKHQIFYHLLNTPRELLADKVQAEIFYQKYFEGAFKWMNPTNNCNLFLNNSEKKKIINETQKINTSSGSSLSGFKDGVSWPSFSFLALSWGGAVIVIIYIFPSDCYSHHYIAWPNGKEC